ncbi:MAG: hypothetical protein U0Q19_09520 [Kineosporiaceae bacterium]
MDPARHTIIYLGNPTVGVRGIHTHIVTTLGGERFHAAALYRKPATPWPPRPPNAAGPRS